MGYLSPLNARGDAILLLIHNGQLRIPTTAPPYGSNPDVAYVLEPLVAGSLRPRFHSYVLVVLVTTTVLVTRTPLLP